MAYLALFTPAWIASVGVVGLGVIVALAWREGVHRRNLLIAHADRAADAIGLFAMQPPTAVPAERLVEETLDEVIDGLRPTRLLPASS